MSKGPREILWLVVGGAPFALLLGVGVFWLVSMIPHTPPPPPVAPPAPVVFAQVPYASLPWKRFSSDPIPLPVAIAATPWVRSPGAPVRVFTAYVPWTGRDIHDPEPVAINKAYLPWTAHPSSPYPISVPHAKVPWGKKP